MKRTAAPQVDHTLAGEMLRKDSVRGSDGLHFDCSDLMRYGKIEGREARITRELLACPERRRLTYSAFLVLTALMTFASAGSKRETAWTSTKQLIELTGKSKRSIVYATSELELGGWLIKVPRKDKPQMVHYRMILPPSVRAAYVERMRTKVAEADAAETATLKEDRRNRLR